MPKTSSPVGTKSKPSSILDFAGVFNRKPNHKMVTTSEMDEILLETAKAADDSTKSGRG